MAVNKVVKSDGTTLIDLSGDTVTSANHIMAGYVGHLADGTQVTGTGQGGSPSSPQFTLIGTSTHQLSAYTNTSTAENINTEIDITNSDCAYILVIITCNGTKTNAGDWGGFFIGIGSRYLNTGRLNCGTGWMASKNGMSLSYADMVNSNFLGTNYGITLVNNRGTINFQRKAHATYCPELMAGTYTVKVYGLTAL